MPLTPGVTERLVPEGLPPEFLTPASFVELAANLGPGSFLHRAYLWATAIITAGFQSTVPLRPRFSHFSAGFIEVEQKDLVNAGLGSQYHGGFTFGGFVVEEFGLERLRIERLRIGNRVLPVVIVSGEIETHGCPPHPTNASSSCWVKSASITNSWSKGILTCRHAVVGLNQGAPVGLVSSSTHTMPSSAVLADITQCTIDAAVLEIDPAYFPTGLSPLRVSRPPAPGMLNVEFVDRTSTKHLGSILRIFHYATYAGNLFGQRVITDCHGARGDSGSLLIDNAGTGVGIYMGTIPNGKGGKDGIFQDLAQAQDYFGLDLFI